MPISFLRHSLTIFLITQGSVQAGFRNFQAADMVLGQSAVSLSTSGNTASRMKEPKGLALDPDGTLWVADSTNHWVLRFDLATIKPNGAPANGLLGQSNFSAGASGLSDRALNNPSSLAVASGGRCWATAFDFYIWGNPPVAGTRNFFRVREVAP